MCKTFYIFRNLEIGSTLLCLLLEFSSHWFPHATLHNLMYISRDIHDIIGYQTYHHVNIRSPRRALLFFNSLRPQNARSPSPTTQFDIVSVPHSTTPTNRHRSVNSLCISWSDSRKDPQPNHIYYHRILKFWRVLPGALECMGCLVSLTITYTHADSDALLRFTNIASSFPASLRKICFRPTTADQNLVSESYSSSYSFLTSLTYRHLVMA